MWLLACLLREQVRYSQGLLPLMAALAHWGWWLFSDCKWSAKEMTVPKITQVTVFPALQVHPHPNPELQPVLLKPIGLCHIAQCRASPPELTVQWGNSWGIIRWALCGDCVSIFSSQVFKKYLSWPFEKGSRASRKMLSLWLSQVRLCEHAAQLDKKRSAFDCHCGLLFKRSRRKTAALAMSEMWEEIMFYHLSGYFATWYATAVNLLDKSSARGS